MYLFIIGTLLLILTACGGGGGGGGDSANQSSSESSRAVILSGVVANPAYKGATSIDVKGANGLSVTTQTDNNGRYSVALGRLTPPFLIRASGPELYTVALSPGTANITPFSYLVLAAATKSDPGNVWADFGSASPALPLLTRENLTVAQKNVTAQIKLLDGGIDIGQLGDVITVDFSDSYATLVNEFQELLTAGPFDSDVTTHVSQLKRYAAELRYIRQKLEDPAPAPSLLFPSFANTHQVFCHTLNDLTTQGPLALTLQPDGSVAIGGNSAPSFGQYTLSIQDAEDGWGRYGGIQFTTDSGAPSGIPHMLNFRLDGGLQGIFLMNGVPYSTCTSPEYIPSSAPSVLDKSITSVLAQLRRFVGATPVTCSAPPSASVVNPGANHLEIKPDGTIALGMFEKLIFVFGAVDGMGFSTEVSYGQVTGYTLAGSIESPSLSQKVGSPNRISLSFKADGSVASVTVYTSFPQGFTCTAT